MKLLNSYSMGASVPIKHKSWLLEQFFPLGEIKKYITLQSKTGMVGKDYKYFQEVIDILFPILEKEGIKILHVGDSTAPQFNKVIDLRNQTNIHQTYHILKNSLLHLTGDTWTAHAAGNLNIPLVELFGPTCSENHSPYFHNKEKSVFLESHRNGNKPSFDPNDPSRSIDLIRPEEVSSAVCKLLNLEHTFPYKTIVFGETYPKRIIESVPDQIIDLSQFQIDNIIFRMDYLHDEKFLFNQLNRSKTSIILNKPVNFDILYQLRGNITQILLEITDNYDIQFAKNCLKLGVGFGMMTYLSEEKLNSIKLDFLDIGMIFPKIVPKQENIKELKDKDLKTLKFKSSKYTLSNGKIYPSKSHFLKGISVPTLDYDFIPCLDDTDFISEKEYYWIVE